MNPVKSQNDKWAEIRKHGLFGRHLEPVLKKPQNHKVVALVGLAILGVTFYWMRTYSGPYRYFAELQLRWIGSYSREVTALLTVVPLFLGVLAVVVLMIFLLRGAERSVPGMPSAPIAASSTVTAVPDFQMVEHWLPYIRYAGLAAVPLVLIGMGAYTYYDGMQAGSVQQLSAVDFQGGKLQGRLVYANVRGHLSEYYVNKDDYFYRPMTSTAIINGPVHLVVGANENQTSKYVHREVDGTFRVEGMADKGLEGDVKYAFEKIGITLSEPVWVVHAGRNPADDRRFGLFTMGLAFPFAGVIYGLARYRKRNRAAARPLQASA